HKTILSQTSRRAQLLLHVIKTPPSPHAKGKQQDNARHGARKTAQAEGERTVAKTHRPRPFFQCNGAEVAVGARYGGFYFLLLARAQRTHECLPTREVTVI